VISSACSVREPTSSCSIRVWTGLDQALFVVLRAARNRHEIDVHPVLPMQVWPSAGCEILGSGVKRALEAWPGIDFTIDHDDCLFTATIARATSRMSHIDKLGYRA
jgi:hypothetical protein